MELKIQTQQPKNDSVAVTLPPAPTIIYTPLAWTKQFLLIMSQSGEVGWHGLVEVVDRDKNIYKITDIIVYPQMVSGATVTTDELVYSNWLGSQPDEIFNGLKAHFHSHVNMATTPSCVDEADKDKIVEQLSPDKPDQFYIFMIWNKKLEFSADIYDVKNHIRWQQKDISIEIEGLGEINKWLEEATTDVKEKKEVKTWTYQRVMSFLIQPNASKTYTSSVVAPSAAPSVNYYRGWDY